ncbi:hypothetical protein DJ56_4105 [Yersinia pestis]|nr:hypothetical protein DJ56_4105 [Yersinia pestis]
MKNLRLCRRIFIFLADMDDYRLVAPQLMLATIVRADCS